MRKEHRMLCHREVCFQQWLSSDLKWQALKFGRVWLRPKYMVHTGINTLVHDTGQNHYFWRLTRLLTYLRRSNLSWSASFNKPNGSQKPRGACAPSASENCIFRDEEDTFELGAMKAAAETREGLTILNWVDCKVLLKWRLTFFN